MKNRITAKAVIRLIYGTFWRVLKQSVPHSLQILRLVSGRYDLIHIFIQNPRQLQAAGSEHKIRLRALCGVVGLIFLKNEKSTLRQLYRLLSPLQDLSADAIRAFIDRRFIRHQLFWRKNAAAKSFKEQIKRRVAGIYRRAEISAIAAQARIILHQRAILSRSIQVNIKHPAVNGNDQNITPPPYSRSV